MVIGLLIFLIFPVSIHAQETCSVKGYTIITVNGVFTDEDGAKKNRDVLYRLLPNVFNNEPLKIDYLHNQSHIAGLGDIIKAAGQKIFDEETISDYDLTEMIADASAKVGTRKLLLVAHSQGNFYANAFYKKVAGKEGGVPVESIGVYSVATPSSYVAGGGEHLTSDTDFVISTIVGHVPFRQIMKPNVSIPLADGEWPGHSFSDVYLKHQGARIVGSINRALDKLTASGSSAEEGQCIDPPKLTLAHKAVGIVLAVADPVASVGKDSVVGAVKVTTFVGQKTMDAAKMVAKVFNSPEAKLGLVPAALTLARDVAPTPGAEVDRPNAEVATATAPSGTNSTAVPATPAGKDSESSDNVGTEATSLEEIATRAIKALNESREVQPRIILLRVSGSPTEPLSEISIIDTEEETATSTATSTSATSAVAVLSAPEIVVSQCADSLSSSACLLATTTIGFGWNAVSGATYYAMSKNGAYATTTGTFVEVTAADFSDYVFSVSAFSEESGILTGSSATSTKAVSVATIPIAINEIAWMGTKASTADEWFEIKNNSSHAISLSGWTVKADDGAPEVALGGTLSPNGYAIFERTDDDSVSGVSAHSVYTGAMSNSGEVLSLSYASTTYDKTPSISGGSWAAGYNSSSERKTMERYDSKVSGETASNWGTHMGFVKNGADAAGDAVLGTPAARNSMSYLLNGGRDITGNLSISSDQNYYAIVDTISVTSSSSLSIGEGVIIKFIEEGSLSADIGLEVYGTLHANGTAENPIIFEPLSGTHVGRIDFEGGSGASTSTLRHVRFENIEGIGLAAAAVEMNHVEMESSESGIDADNGSHLTANDIYVLDTIDTAIAIYESTATISSSTISGTGGHGISIDDSKVTISSTTISDVDRTGVEIEDSSTVTINGSTIKEIEEGEGIGIYDSTVSVSNTIISDIRNAEGVAAYDSTVNISSSTIEIIRDDDGIGAYDSSIIISSSTIRGVYDGDGIGLYDSTLIISSSTIADVYDGNGIGSYDSVVTISTSTISNTSEEAINLSDSQLSISGSRIEGGEASQSDGIGVYDGSAEISSTIVSGFTEGAGVAAYPDGTVEISGDSEITGNAQGIVTDDEASIVIGPDVSVHDNGSGPADNFVIDP